jgi:hypothetical protein
MLVQQSWTQKWKLDKHMLEVSDKKGEVAQGHCHLIVRWQPPTTSALVDIMDDEREDGPSKDEENQQGGFEGDGDTSEDEEDEIQEMEKAKALKEDTPHPRSALSGLAPFCYGLIIGGTSLVMIAAIASGLGPERTFLWFYASTISLVMKIFLCVTLLTTSIYGPHLSAVCTKLFTNMGSC